jgi:hypothetical protein
MPYFGHRFLQLEVTIGIVTNIKLDLYNSHSATNDPHLP